MAKNNKKDKLALRLANAGLQMGVVIFLGSFGGDYLDKVNENETPIFTVIGSLLGVFIGLYILYKGVVKISK